MEIDVLKLDGSLYKKINVNSNMFCENINVKVLHDVLRLTLANRRSYTANTKSIGDIRGTTAKPHKQKGTGKARQGSLRSPQFRGGAVVFGPKSNDRSYNKINKTMKNVALKNCLSYLKKENKLVVIDKLDVDCIKTKDFIKLNLFANYRNSKVLFIGVGNDNFIRCTNNLKNVLLINREECINVVDLLKHDIIILDYDVLQYLERRFL